MIYLFNDKDKLINELVKCFSVMEESTSTYEVYQDNRTV